MENKMKKLLLMVLVAVVALPVYAGTAYLKYSYISGMNRVCVYDDYGSEFYITIESHHLCPLAIEV